MSLCTLLAMTCGCHHWGSLTCVEPVPEVLGSPSFMEAHRRLPLSSHSRIALSRCSNLRGTVLACLAPRNRGIVGEEAVTAAKCAARANDFAAHSKPAGESMQTSA